MFVFRERDHNREAYEGCIHACACARAYECLHGVPYHVSDIYDALGCDECQEWNDSHPKAKRILRSQGAVGRCNCSACNWIIDPYDAYCRRCGAKLTESVRDD